jgi:chemotaxis protein methyltransferase CheR
VSWTHPGYEAVAELLVQRTGLVFGPTRRASAETGIQRAMSRARVAVPERYLELLNTNADALDDLVVELTVGETYFFREPAQFAFVRSVVLPEIWRRHGPGATVRAWSAACASGEEAYSLAILLAQEGAGLQSHLLATDISRAALAKARRAVYGAWSLRGEGAAAARPYLQPQSDARFLLDDRIRRRVRFEYLNLALDVYPSLTTDTWGMHIVFCRNVLIYFNQETIEATARRLYQSLAPGGWLFTAASDPPLAPYARFEPVTTDAGVFYRRKPGSVLHAMPAIPWLEKKTERQGEKETGRQGDKETRRQGDKETGVIFTPVSPSPPDLVSLSPLLLVSLSPCLPVSLSPEPSPEPAVAPDPLAEAKQAFAEGDYHRAVERTRGRIDDPAACVVQVRSLANLGADQAEQVCAEATARHPLSTELHYLHAVLLLSLGRDKEAIQAVRRVLYLDRSLAVGHFTLGAILERRGDLNGARRAYRNVGALCRARPADEPAPLSDGEPAGRLGEAAAMQLAILSESVVRRP